MPTVADVLRQYSDQYLQRFGRSMPAEHRKVLNAITACRTGRLGIVRYTCSSCGRTHVMGRSCGNRHCPTCQKDKTKAWLAKQTARLLPTPYFLMTFTLPAELRRLARRHQRVMYAALFEASSQALLSLAADPKYIGSPRCGFFGVLHTWGRTLDYHPHVHYVVPGGAVSQQGDQWLAARPNFFVPVKALSIIFRAKFRDIMTREGLLKVIDPAVWRRDWVVHSKAVGDGRASLCYLAPYVFRVAISDRRIVASDAGHVTFSYRQSGSNRWRQMTVTALEFIRRFLQHVLPSGFQKVRHYGFLSPNSQLSIEAVRWLIFLHDRLIFLLWALQKKDKPVSLPLRCAECGALMCVEFFPPSLEPLYYDTS